MVVAAVGGDGGDVAVAVFVFHRMCRNQRRSFASEVLTEACVPTQFDKRLQN